MEKYLLIVGDGFDKAKCVLKWGNPAFEDLSRVSIDVLLSSFALRVPFPVLRWVVLVPRFIDLSALLNADVEGDGLFSTLHLSQIKFHLFVKDINKKDFPLTL